MVITREIRDEIRSVVNLALVNNVSEARTKNIDKKVTTLEQKLKNPTKDYNEGKKSL